MADGIEIEGMEEFTSMLENMTIDEADERNAVRRGLDIVDKSLDGQIPIGKTKRLSKRKKSVKKEGFATVGTVRLTAFYDFMREFGTSQSKANAGFFDRAVKSSEDEALAVLTKELLEKAR
ncbi:HK97-gp10 family putative phage morphogenesis protein [Clostridium botulinum]|uniref:HK97-gp10 family putative phage morphogenesis protein n=1 Tax=Clostridium botulinum TaxID=1491 RepID=UPI00016B9F92|nr:HK97-gp10 family putative phage morphogenesis protein [Clostridium botulinum]EDT84681.1 phage protein, HK97 gp10 family [Clostridium botulinum Bf]